MRDLEPMDILLQALESGANLWEQSLQAMSAFHFLLTLLYLVPLGLCLANGQAARQSGEADRVWWIAALLLGLLAANTVLNADVFVSQSMRALLKLSGLYGERRPWQYGVVGLLAVVFLWLAARVRHAFVACDVASEAVPFGLIILLALLALRLVSAHDTDAILNLDLDVMTLGRALELLGLGLLAHGCWLCLELR